MNKSAVIFDDNGKIVRRKWGGESGVVQTAENSGFNFIYFDYLPEVEGKYVENGVLVDLPPQPSVEHTFNYATKQWVYDLTRHRQEKWAEIKAARSADEFGTFTWSTHMFQCDEVSQRRIQGAVQLAQLDSTTTLDWTLADNSVQTFNATELQQIGQALAAHVNACHVKSRTKRGEIDAATTQTELDAITW